MKILHVIPSVGPQRGGPSFAVRAIAGGLAAHGVETHVIATDDDDRGRMNVPLDQPVEENGVVYRYFPRQSRHYVSSLPLSSWLWRHAQEYDVIHVHAVFSYCSNAAAWIAHRKGVPYIIRPLGVLNRWGIENRRPALKKISFALLEKRLLERATFVHYTTQQEQIEAAELNFRHRALIIPNPITVPVSRAEVRGEFRACHPQLNGRRIVLFLSRIDKKKGLDLLIPAFQRVLKEVPDAVLVIAGEGDARLTESLREQARQCGVAGEILWPGFLSGRMKYAALADADLFVLPSYSENFGNAVVEAMALETPVVVTDQVGIHREITAAQSGLVVPTAAPAIAEAIARLLQDGALRHATGRNGAELARSEFAPNRVLGRLIDTYSGIIAPRCQPQTVGAL